MANMTADKPAEPAGNDVVDGFYREWFKVGRKYFGVTTGYLIDGEGFVAGIVHNNDAYRVAEALRRFISVKAAISADVTRLVAREKMH